MSYSNRLFNLSLCSISMLLIETCLLSQAVIGQVNIFNVESNIQYQPQPDQEAPSEEASTTGTRGECKAFLKEIPLTPLVPHSDVGFSVSTSPILVFYLPEHEEPQPLEVTLSIYDEPGKISEADPLVISDGLLTKSGINTVDLQKFNIKLDVDQTYLWDVEIQCHAGSKPLVSADLKVVNENIPLNNRWYDLLTMSLNELPDTQKIVNLLESLINVEKNKLELNSDENNVSGEMPSHIKNLEAIQEELALP